MAPKRSLAVWGTALAVLLVCAGGLVYTVNSMLLPVDAGAVDKTIEVTVPRGADTAQIAAILAEKGVIRNALFFRAYARWSKLDKGFIAGDYRLSPSMDLGEVVAKITGGEVHRETVWFTIPEGFTVEQIAGHLAGLGLADRDRFLELARQPSENLLAHFPFIRDAAVPGVIYTLEGYLFPDTYEIIAGATEEEIATLMLQRLDRLIGDANLHERCRELEMSLHEALTLASIVEREARVDHERKLIAGVFYNRLALSYPLESCATVNYVLPEFKEVLSAADTAYESPYNTYKYPGLPPGPIAAPGEPSILAAFYPENTDYFYFRSKEDGSGESYFARTLQEHNQNTLKAEQNKRS